MSRYDTVQNNFTGGEVSPRFRGRVDQPKYFTSVSTLTGMKILPLGGVTRIPGSRFVGEVKNSAHTTRLVEFEFSDIQQYVLEFGNQYIRFYTNEGRLLEANKTITGATQANPVVVTSAAHGYNNGDWIYISSVAGMTQLNGKYFKVANKTTDTFELQNTDGANINGTAFGAYTSGGTAARVYEITTVYPHTVVNSIKYIQSADVVYLFVAGYAPYKIQRAAATSWTITKVEWLDGPYGDVNVTTTTLTPSGGTYTPGATPTVTASSTTGINGGSGFLTTDVGRLIRIKNGSDWAWGEIATRSSSTVVTVTVKGKISFPSTAQTDWRLGAWSETTGWPTCATFHQQRLMAAATSTQPQTLWGTVSADIENFAPGTIDDSAVTYTLVENKVYKILSLLSADYLVVCTAGGVTNIGGGNNLDDAITPSNVTARPQNSVGCSSVQSIIAGGGVVYVNRTARGVYDYGYNFEKNKYLSTPLNLLADHLTFTGIEEIKWASSSDSYLYARLGNGDVIILTYLPTQQVTGWSRMGRSGETQSIATILSSDAAYDQLWMINKYIIDGDVRQYVEYLVDDFEDGDDIKDAFFVSCGLTYDGTPITSLSGLEHLEGEEVTILADGATHPNKTVTNGAITLERSASVVHVGLHDNWQLTPLPFDLNLPNGSTHSTKKRQYAANIQLNNTVGFNVSSNGRTYPQDFRDAQTNMDEAIQPYSGFFSVDLPTAISDYNTFDIIGDQPLPCTILSMVVRVEGNKI